MTCFVGVINGRVFPHSLGDCRIDKIYQLGDSIADSGNLIRESINGSSLPFANLPYGESYSRNPTGRCSNGLLMIDYVGTYVFHYTSYVYSIKQTLCI